MWLCIYVGRNREYSGLGNSFVLPREAYGQRETPLIGSCVTDCHDALPRKTKAQIALSHFVKQSNVPLVRNTSFVPPVLGQTEGKPAGRWVDGA